MRKNYFMLIVIALITCLIFTGGVFAQDINPTPENPVTLRVGTTDQKDDLSVGLEYTMTKVFESMVETNSGGAIQVEVFPASQLGSLMSMLESTQAGEIEAVTGTAAIPSFYPEWQVFSIPYLFENSSIAMSVMNESEFMLDLYEDMRKETGLRVLGVAQNGFRHFTNNEGTVHTPEDLEGLKFRVMQGPIYQKVVEAAGATAVPISWSEVYTSLKTGVVDGQENPISSIVLGSLYEVQDYVTLDGHLWSENYLVMNDDFYNSLPKKFQNVIKEAGKAAATSGTASEHIKSYITGVEIIKDDMEIYNPTPQELEQFKNKIQPPVVEWLKAEIGKDLVDGMLETVEEYTEKYNSQ